MTTRKPIFFHRQFVSVLAVCLLSFHSVGAAPVVKETSVKEKAVQEVAAAVAGEKVAPKVEKPAPSEEKPAPKVENPASKDDKEGKPSAAVDKPVEKEAGKPEGAGEMKKPEDGEAAAMVDPDDEVAAENQDAQVAAVAKPVSADPIQIYGWREDIMIKDVVEKIQAKLDTGALTSSIHAEEMELFERDGKKWVRFIVTDPSVKKPARTRIEAPLVRIARIKEPGAESVAREVVKLSFTIGDRKMRGEFTLNNRSNMLAPVLIGRSLIKDLGWVDASRTYLADEKIFR